MPNVSMVFSSVWLGNVLGRHEKKLVHRIIASAIVDTIYCVGGGYCCRMQETELKYMTVFADPQVVLNF